MNVRLLIAAGAVGLLLAFGMVAGGCKNGGGGALTLEEYFQQLDELDNDLNEQSDALFAPLEDVQDPGEAVEQLRDIFPQQAGLFQDFRGGLADLDPPGEVEDLHNEALEAFDGVIAAVDGLVGQLDSVESFDDLDALFAESEFSAADERLTQVCLDLEQMAADNNITVDFNCGDESDGTDGVDGTPTSEGPDGDTGALEDYFQQLDAAENELRGGQGSVDESFAAIDDSTPPDEVIAAFEEAKAVIDDFVAGMQDIDPPPEAAAAHEETIAAFQVVSGIISDAIDVVEGGGTAQEAAALLSSPDATEADTALDATCNALQSLADSNGIAVDLSCDN